jgi:predicted GNAT family N-acyltransferase
MKPWVIREADWADPQDQKPLKMIRHEVFIEEQGVPESLEWDQLDADSQHFLAYQQEQPIGCVRLLPTGHIGRMAVLAPWRRKGVASALLEACEVRAMAKGFQETRLSAQTQAIAFYEKAGYRIISDSYLDAGIPHQDMIKILRNSHQ